MLQLTFKIGRILSNTLLLPRPSLIRTLKPLRLAYLVPDTIE
jgi:hypothetical protein